MLLAGVTSAPVRRLATGSAGDGQRDVADLAHLDAARTAVDGCVGAKLKDKECVVAS
jgi:hypothetical protein